MNETEQPITEPVSDGVAAVIAEQLGIPFADVKAAATLASLGADSLDHVEIVIALEDEFAITIPDDDWDRVRTVQGAIDVTNAQLILAAAPKRHGVPA